MDNPGRSCGGIATHSRKRATANIETETPRRTCDQALKLETHKPVVIRRIPWDETKMSRETLLDREWIVTNGLGGYSSGTISGAITRRYHGLLIAALAAPLGRVVMWSHVSEVLCFGENDTVSLGAEERAGGQLELKSAEYLREFQLEDGLPVWVYHVRDLVLEKRVTMPHLQNTVHVNYRILQGESRPCLELRPAFHFGHHEAAVNKGTSGPYRFSATGDRYEIAAAKPGFPPVRMKVCGDSNFTIAAKKGHQVVYRSEQLRGYAYEGDLWSPGYFDVDLAPDKSATVIASTEKWEIIDVLGPEDLFVSEQRRRRRLLEKTRDG